MPFPNLGAQVLESSCSIRAAVLGSSGAHPWECPCLLESLIFGILADKNPTHTEPRFPKGAWGWFFSPRKKKKKFSLLPGGSLPYGKLGQPSAAPGSHPGSPFPGLRWDPFSSVSAEHHSQLSPDPGKISASPNPLGLPGPHSVSVGSSGMGICASQMCWLSLEPGAPPGSGEGAWDRRICPVLRAEPAASMGMADPFPSWASLVQQDAGKERNQLSRERTF